MPGLLLIVYLVLIAPVKIGAAVSAGGGPPEAAVGVMIWGARIAARLRLRWMDGAPRLCASFRGRTVTIRPRQNSRGWSAKALRLLAQSLIRRGRRRWLRPVSLEGVILIGGQDAARVALLTGSVRGLLGMLPTARVRCFPAFGGPSAMQLRCIAQARLGTILAAGLLTALDARRAGRKEENPWIIPSDS